MPKQSVFKGLSKRAQKLLSSPESLDVDFKSKPKGVSADDLVAFANSEHGGAILIGVEERTSPAGVQYGEPVGCTVDDETRLLIMSRAASCSPAVQLAVFIENTQKAPFLRIEIPSGSSKPYATGGGTYKIRSDGRNRPVPPNELLKIQLETQGNEFKERFETATQQVGAKLEEMLDSVAQLEARIQSEISDIGSTLGWAEYKAGDAADIIETVEFRIRKLERTIANLDKRLRVLVQASDQDDPVKAETEAEVREQIKDQMEEDPELLKAIAGGQSVQVTLSATASEELDSEDLRRILHEAAQEVLGDDA